MTKQQAIQMAKNTEFNSKAASFAMRIKVLRSESRGTRHNGRMSTVDAAKLCGISPNQWSSLESGKFTPFSDLVFHIEKCFEVEPGTLSCLLGYMPVDPVSFEIGKFDPIIAQLDYQIRAALYNAGITNTEELTKLTESDISGIVSGFGPAKVKKIQELLLVNGLKLSEKNEDPIISQLDSATQNSLHRIGVWDTNKLLKKSRKEIYSDCSHIGAVRIARLEELLSANGLQLAED